MPTQRLIPPTMLHRFDLPCHRTSQQWSEMDGITLEHQYAVANLCELDDVPPFAMVKMAWAETGLFFTVDVQGKKQSVWCRETQLTQSDGVQVWIDTRNTHNVHRASRFCHWFLFLPTGGGVKKNQPIATMLKINRAREDPRTLNQVRPQARATIRPNGYQLAMHVSARALTGWDPADHRKLGFNLAVIDQELGWQTLSVGPEFPIAEDPSLWQTISLVD